MAGLLAAAAVSFAASLVVGDGGSPPDAPQRAEASIMDDQLFLGASDADLQRAMRSLREIGVDRLRVSAFWRDHAPEPEAMRKPPGFRAEDPGAPGYRWESLDRVVRAAGASRLKVNITITTPAPLWASEEPDRRNPVWKPLPEEFAAYASAVARRYGDRAANFGLMNEPNQGGWLQPQSEDGRAAAPHLYRRLVELAYPAVKRAAPRSTVLVGELASKGVDAAGERRPIRPLAFLRAMGCRDEAYRPLDVPDCARFRPVPLDALAHHPYQPLSGPFEGTPDRDDAGIADTPRLLATLDRLRESGALDPSGEGPLDVYYTEFGYQTDPPDPFAGVPLERQDRWLQEAAYVAWREPRVRELNQFRLSDGAIRGDLPGRDRYREFQSGLYFADLRPKPSARDFPHPFVIVPGRQRAFWGQVRPGGAHEVTLERAARRTGPFEEVEALETDEQGYFLAEPGSAEPGWYRFTYRDGGRTVPSSVLRLR